MKRAAIASLVAVVAVMLQVVLSLSPWGEAIEMRFLDLWLNLRGSRPPPSDVVVVAMDEESYKNLGFSLNQAWPRAAHAKLLRQLKQAGARKVVLDILFFDAGTDPAADDALARALGAIPSVIGADLGMVEQNSYNTEALLLPIEEFRTKARVALVGLPEEREFVRRFLTPGSEQARGLPTLAEEAVEGKAHPGPRDLINYYGPTRTIRTFSYYQALESEHPLPPETFRNKIVFVGLSMRTELGPAQKDAYLTSFTGRGRTFGVEIHATAAGNMLEGSWIRRSTRAREIAILAIVAAIVVFGLFFLRPVVGAIVVAAYALGWAAIAYGSFCANRFLPGATLGVATLPLAYLSTTLYYYIVTVRERRRLVRAFQFYLSPEMAREVALNPQALRLGGEKVEATALFSDIAGFTGIAESLPPEEVARMLNAYFTEVMNEIFENRGTLIKFIGDAVFALWGAPIKTPNHAQLACETALAIQRNIERFNASGRFPALHTRIGIHSGPMIVGNLGSARRFDFTAIGDTINLASRVEGLNKYFGTSILITVAVRDQLNGPLPLVRLGAIRPVGMKLPVDLYALLTKPIPTESGKLWEEALGRFTARRWTEAATAFGNVAASAPSLQKSAALYLEQVDKHRSQPPSDTWRGEISFLAK